MQKGSDEGLAGLASEPFSGQPGGQGGAVCRGEGWLKEGIGQGQHKPSQGAESRVCPSPTVGLHLSAHLPSCLIWEGQVYHSPHQSPGLWRRQISPRHVP